VQRYQNYVDIKLWLLRDSTVSLIDLLLPVTNAGSMMMDYSTEGGEEEEGKEEEKKASCLTRNVVMLWPESCPDRVKLVP